MKGPRLKKYERSNRGRHTRETFCDRRDRRTAWARIQPTFDPTTSHYSYQNARRLRESQGHGLGHRHAIATGLAGGLS